MDELTPYFVELVEREVGEFYTTSGERAAYRAGLLTATALIDGMARKLRVVANKQRGCRLKQRVDERASELETAARLLWELRKKNKRAAPIWR